MPKNDQGLRIYYASNTFGGNVPPQKPSDPLERADAILRRLKNEICAECHPAQFAGDIKRNPGWAKEIDDALECLTKAYAKKRKLP